MNNKQLVEKFQCPGCVCGMDTTCGHYDFGEGYELRCQSHLLGTQLRLGNIIALGLPKGFNKPGRDDNGRAKNKINLRMWRSGEYQIWDNLNVPVWAMVDDGFLFVRTFAPRINETWVDVVEGGTLDMVPSAIDVSEFLGEID